jgi:hypothetical protein
MRDWLPPEPPRAHPGWAVASVLAHAALVAVLLAISGSVLRDPSQSYIVVEPRIPGPVVYIDLPYVTGAGGGAGPETGIGPGTVPAPAPVAGAGDAGAGMPLRIEPDSAPGPGLVPPTGWVGEGPGRRRLGPGYGDGRIWVRPLDAIAAAIAGMGDDSTDAKSHVARIDSAIAARIAAFLDTLGPDPMATPAPKPWVTEVGGQKWGIDQGWIYLGNLKLPSAILALLPLPQGNYELAQEEAELQRIRVDIIQSARRAESAEQFKKYVQETRKRRDAEREARKNQQTKPDSIKT